ncbi:hypothetical protein [Phocaeicola barnesiae]|uniref:hypothetical protein n=1 Tax=Phocaeicola barnesiae TaxID=376804 RepID=UPI00242D587B|nr:hypothetical protein [Phocaeicola barnesiae]
MKTLKVTLKQHTPLIHFQHDQYGATLRASEFKPRFDKYLTQTIERGNYDYWKRFLVGSVVDANIDETAGTSTQNNLNARNAKLMNKFNEGFCALDYKLKIVASGSTSQEMESLPMYFANQGNVEYKYDVYSQKDIILEFSSFHDELLGLIEKHLNDFLARTNFGSRQTKGYGSFYRKGEEPEKANYYFIVKTSDSTILFKSISDFYAVIRSGINDGLYIKSALFKYLKEYNRQWDKRSIKGFFYQKSEIKAEQTDHPEADSPLVEVNPGSRIMYKELLGLSTSELWLKKGATLTRENKEIQRFKSPILFKPIHVEEGEKSYYKVFIYLTPIPQEIRGKAFEIKWSLATESETMYMSDFFQIEDYFKWIFDNKSNLVTISNPSSLSKSQKSRYDTLNRLFNTLTKG